VVSITNENTICYNESMARTHKYINPFYGLLIPVGVAFVISASAYGVMAVRDTSRSASGEPKEQTGLLGFMDRQGVWVLGTEVLLLGLLTGCAIGTDEIWFRKAAAKSEENASLKKEISQLPYTTSGKET
jgi:hypothetical protein